MTDASTALSKWKTKMDAATTWTNAKTNYDNAKTRMKNHYPFGGAMGNNYKTKIDAATWRQPNSADITKGYDNLKAKAGL